MVASAGDAVAGAPAKAGSHTTSVASANVELVRSIFAVWEHGDFGSAEWADPEIEYIVADGPSPGRWTRPAGMQRARVRGSQPGRTRGLWSRITASSTTSVSFVLTRFGGRGRTSGVELEEVHAKGAWLFQIREQTVTSIVQYLDRDRALADLDVATEDPSGR